MSNPLVSVLMLTYNHEKFISQALESVFSQKVDFEIEVVIGDDYSTDSTRKILKIFKQRFPKQIRLLLNSKNCKPVANYINVYKHCRGKYIAVLEGDDYWTSPEKLMKQVRYLENHQNCAICFHSTSMINKEGEQLLLLPIHPLRKKVSYLIDLIWYESFMASCSTMYRNNLFGDFPDWFNSLTYIADLPLNILNAQNGDIGYINETMSVYRSASSENAFSSMSPLISNIEGTKMFLGMNKQLKSKYYKIFIDKISRNCFVLAQEFLKLGKIELARQFYSFYRNHHISNRYVSVANRIFLPIKLNVATVLNFA